MKKILAILIFMVLCSVGFTDDKPKPAEYKKPAWPQTSRTPDPVLTIDEKEIMDAVHQYSTIKDRLCAILKSRDFRGEPVPEAILAIEALARLRAPEAMEYLLDNVAVEKGGSGYSIDFKIDLHPCLRAIICEYGASGVEAIIQYAAKHKEGSLSDEKIDLLAYAILVHCGFDEAGRNFALSWTDLFEKRLKQTGELNRLREQLFLSYRYNR